MSTVDEYLSIEGSQVDLRIRPLRRDEISFYQPQYDVRSISSGRNAFTSLNLVNERGLKEGALSSPIRDHRLRTMSRSQLRFRHVFQLTRVCPIVRSTMASADVSGMSLQLNDKFRRVFRQVPIRHGNVFLLSFASNGIVRQGQLRRVIHAIRNEGVLRRELVRKTSRHGLRVQVVSPLRVDGVLI